MNRDQYLAVPGFGKVYFNIQTAFLTISEEFRSTYYFDAEGRFLGSFLTGINYQRSLDNNILMKYIDPAAGKIRRFLSPDERYTLLSDVLARVARIRDYIAHTAPDGYAALLPWLDNILAWDAERLETERERFQSIYRPVPILPPDQYLSVVLQATEGCSWNQCTFCTFYRGSRFKIKTPAEFRQHAQQVRAFFGSGIRLRKSIFLADANALITPQPRLIELLRIVHEEFSIGTEQTHADNTLHGIYSFLDIFGAERKTLNDYRQLKAHRVNRIYIGLESGDDELFRLLNKPGSPQECIEVVRTIKAAGIDVGIIMLAGAGGERLATQHLRNSIQAIAAMQLGRGDIIYVSPLVLAGDDEYSQRMRELGIQPLEKPDILAQVKTIKDALKTGSANRPRVTLYNIEEFLY